MPVDFAIPHDRLNGRNGSSQLGGLVKAHFGENGVPESLRPFVDDVAKALDARPRESEPPGNGQAEMLQLILDTIPQRVFWKDRDCRFLGSNQVFADDHGRSNPSEMIGLDDFKTSPNNEDAAAFQRIDRQVMESGEPRFKMREKRELGHGKVAWLETSKIPLRDADGAVIGLLGTYEDISERVQSRETLERLNTELARALDTTDTFLSSMSHELRTPLNAILGLSEALVDGVYGEVSPRQSEALGHVAHGGRDLLSIIDDILEFTRLQRADIALDLAPADVAEIGSTCLATSMAEAEAKNIVLTSDAPADGLLAMIDRTRVARIVGNLLQNAIKFTPPGGSVHLSVSTDGPERTLRIAVTDSGCGFEPADIGHLFEPFVQLDNGLTRGHEGTGLGLALAAGLARAHGGAVEATSTPGEGSRFTLTLPHENPA